MARRYSGIIPGGRPTRLTSDEIVRSAEVAEVPDAQIFKKVTGNSLHLVSWTGGPTALVEAIPSDRPRFKRLLVKLYRNWCAGRRHRRTSAR